MSYLNEAAERRMRDDTDTFLHERRAPGDPGGAGIICIGGVHEVWAGEGADEGWRLVAAVNCSCGRCGGLVYVPTQSEQSILRTARSRSVNVDATAQTGGAGARTVEASYPRLSAVRALADKAMKGGG